MTALEIVDSLCAVIKMQADIIKSQHSVIEESTAIEAERKKGFIEAMDRVEKEINRIVGGEL